MPTTFYGLPSINDGNGITPRNIFTTQSSTMFGQVPSGYIVAGALSRDPGTAATTNGHVTILRPGLIMGKVSGGTYDKQYAPSIIGVLNRTGATTTTTLTLQPAVATEVQRLITLQGTSNNFIILSPTTSGGTLVSTTVSATSATTGSNSSNSYMTLSGSINTLTVAGGIVTRTDSSQTGIAVLAENAFGVAVTDINGTSINQPLANYLIRADFISAQLINFLADDYGVSVDSAVITKLKSNLISTGNQFTFSDNR